MGGHHLVPGGLRRRSRKDLPLSRLTDGARTQLLPPSRNYSISSPGSYTFGLGLADTAGFPGALTCGWQLVGPLGPHNCLSQFFALNHPTPTHLLLVGFPWRAPIHYTPVAPSLPFFTSAPVWLVTAQPPLALETLGRNGGVRES